MTPPAVLVVDDRPENLLALEGVLAGLDARVVRAASGHEAVERVAEQAFAAILLDVHMPGMDGFEAATRIHRRGDSAHTPIIFLTAEPGDVATIARAYEVGAVDYVLKPFDPVVLRAKVAVFCELARERDARARSDRLLRAAWESAPSGMALVDAGGRLLEANPALRLLMGRDIDELRGGLEQHVSAADRPALAVLREQLIADGGGAGAVELHVVHPQRGEIPTSVLASAVPEPDGRPRTFLLQVADLSERQRVREAQATLAAEQAARAEAEGLAARLAAVAAITEGLERHATGELVEVLCERLVRVLRLDGATLGVLGEHGRVVARSASGEPTDDEVLETALAGDPQGPVVVRERGTTVLPLRVDGKLIGVLAVVGLVPSAPVHAQAFALLLSAVERAALILERARLHERERLIAATLQRDLLPETLPSVPGVSLSAFFTAGGDGVHVGGDWYDALALPGGRLGLVVGDVAGRGVAAAARMGELRAVARAYALEGHAPAEVLRRMNAYHLSMGSDTMTTLVYAVVEPDRDRASFATAGHMPPLLVGGGAAGAAFVRAVGPPLGVLEVGRYQERQVDLPPGAMLVLYTDGLVERRGEVIDAGLGRLRDALGGDAPTDVEDARARALTACGASAVDDDVTLVVVRAEARLGSPVDYTLTPDPEALGALRRHIRRWLAEAGADAGETAAIVMAINEAMQNAIEHGNAFGVAPITVLLDLRGDDVVVVVRDLGHDGPRRPDPDRGRGVELMESLMDDARIDLGGPMGGTVTLRRRLCAARAPAALHT